MVSKNTIKLIKSLALKKVRNKEKLFLVEGDKNVAEVLNSEINVEKLIATAKFAEAQKGLTKNAREFIEATEGEIKKASILKNPQNSIAICSIPGSKDLPKNLNSDLTVFLDGIQDPGNLGTILRICDWFGVTELYCSSKTADVYNPKVIQASMGSFCRVIVYYIPFENLVTIAESQRIPIIGAFLEGENIYTEKLPRKALLVMGNEGNGISTEIEKLVERKINIPGFNPNPGSAESLNVSVATAIICSEFFRQKNYTNYSK